MVDKLPDYFFEVPASSTGKYHPRYAIGDGGLVRHTKAAVAIAYDLLKLESCKFTAIEKDLVIAALILHDGCKSGKEKQAYTIATHPIEITNYIKEFPEIVELLGENAEILYAMIESHMGEWNEDYKTKKAILPKPETDLQIFVHIADYLASRKYLSFEFGDDYYDPTKFIDSKLDDTITNIVILCKKLISEGESKDNLYEIIAKNNNGRKNPNSIDDFDSANAIFNELQEVC